MQFLGTVPSFKYNGLRLLPGILLLILAIALSACNSGSLSDGLQSAATPQPAQPVNNAGTVPNNGQINVDATTSPANPQVAGVAGIRPVAFLPVSNAPQSAVTNLAKSIRSAATASGVPVVASVQQGAQYQVKGYFSALEDGSGTLLVYVWDVLDTNNKRVYRINGQETASSKAADPWGAVTPEMLDRVAQATMSQLKSWLATRG
jgi:hypothetical protein